MFLPPSSRAPLPTTAAQFIVDTVLADPDEATIVLLGPFTNMALAMMLCPGLTQHVKQIVVMGGAAFTSGNASPASEANVLNDPEAADIVFGADCPIVMAGLDVTHRITMTDDDLARFAAIDNPRAQLAAQTLDVGQSGEGVSVGRSGCVWGHRGAPVV